MNGLIAKMAQKKKDELDTWLQHRMKEMSLPEDVYVISNVAYADDGHPAHRMDIFRSKAFDGEEKLPVIVNVHGGGLLKGSKEVNAYFNAWLAQQGYLVFSIEYRLVPETLVYGQFADVSLAMNAVDDMLEIYQGDRERVFMVGDSAGAFLIVYTVAMQKSRKLAEAAGVTPFTLPIKALGLQSGMYYTTKRDEIGLFLSGSLYGKGYKKRDFFPYINPEHKAVAGNLPPCFLTTSDEDNLQKYTLWFARTLEKAGVPYKLENYSKNPNVPHAFNAMYPERTESMEANRKMLAYFEAL